MTIIVTKHEYPIKEINQHSLIPYQANGEDRKKYYRILGFYDPDKHEFKKYVDGSVTFDNERVEINDLSKLLESQPARGLRVIAKLADKETGEFDNKATINNEILHLSRIQSIKN